MAAGPTRSLTRHALAVARDDESVDWTTVGERLDVGLRRRSIVDQRSVAEGDEPLTGPIATDRPTDSASPELVPRQGGRTGSRKPGEKRGIEQQREETTEAPKGIRE